MRKYEDSKVPITIDPITNQYQIVVPEWVINEFDWYEDLVLKWNIDKGDIYITEADD